MTSRSSTPSDQDEAAHQNSNPMASSLAGLPVRPQANGSAGSGEGAGAVGAKAQGSGQLKDFLDLAVSSIPKVAGNEPCELEGLFG
jgi:hypothetical protein